MKKYKVEITKTYCLDIYAKNKSEDEIIKEAEEHLDQAMLAGTEHYLQTSDTEFYIHDVTNTDDPFYPVNEE